MPDKPQHSSVEDSLGATECAPLSAPNAALTVFYDGACPVCSREIAFYRQRGSFKEVNWVDATSCAEVELPHSLTREQALQRFHIRLPDQTLCSGPLAFGVLWERVKALAWLGKLMQLESLQPTLEFLYRQFLSLRKSTLGHNVGTDMKDCVCKVGSEVFK